MDKLTNLKGIQLWGFLYLDTIPFKLVSLSIVGVLYLDTIPFKLVYLKGLVSRYKNPTQWTNILT
jgi:hypothetical protein